jgi:nucleoside-diphosphate-sugar epimerase
MTSLVTGATGLLGSHVVEVLRQRQETVRAMVREGEPVDALLAAGADVVRGDMQDQQSLARAIEGVDRVFHCAARTGVWGPTREFQLTNVRGLRWLVDAAMSAGVRRLVHVSSVTAHGVDLRGSGDEDSPLRGGPDPYSRSKASGERMLQRLVQQNGAPVAIVRPGLLYGPRDTNSFGRFTAMIEAGRMVTIGAGTNHLPLLYAADAAAGVVLAGFEPVPPGRAFVLVGEPVTQSEYLGAIADVLGVPHPSRHIPYRPALALGALAEAGGHVLRLRQPPPITRFGLQALGGENLFRATRARTELGWQARTTLADGVARGVAWYRAWRQGEVEMGVER